MSRSDGSWSRSNPRLAGAGRRGAWPAAAGLLAGLLGLLLGLAPARAIEVVEVRSPGGLVAWLVEDHSRPTLSLGFRFAGGAGHDPAGREGLAQLVADLAFEGAGDLSTERYLEEWARIGAEATLDARQRSLKGTLRALTRDLERAGDLLRLALLEPRLDDEAIERVREALLATIDQQEQDPALLADATWRALVYPGQVLGRQVEGTSAGVAAIGKADIAEQRRRLLRRGGLSLAVVGDITPAALGRWLDRVFGSLPDGTTLGPLPPQLSQHGRRLDLTMSASQAQVAFGLAVPVLSAADSHAAEIVNYVLGGSTFTSRLHQELRERRGLVYSIATDLELDDLGNRLVGDLGTAPETLGEALSRVRQIVAELARDGPTPDEVEEAKAALAGEYLRALVRQQDLADELAFRRFEGRASTYVGDYPARLRAVRNEDVHRVARRILAPEALTIVTVGGP